MTSMYRFAVVLACSLLFCCTDKESDPAPVPVETQLIKLSVMPSYMEAKEDAWVVVLNEAGEAIAGEPLAEGIEISLQGMLPKGQLVNVLLFSKMTTESAVYSYMNAYTKVTPGQEWTLANVLVQSPPVSGLKYLQISNLPSEYRPLGVAWFLTQNDWFGYKFSSSCSGSDCSSNIFLPSDDAFTLSLVPGAADPYYCQSVVSEAETTLDFETDFRPFENVLTIEDPGLVNASLLGHLQGGALQAHSGYLSNLSGELDVLKLGYFPGHSEYFSVHSFQKGGKSYNFSVVADHVDPANFTAPAQDFTVTNNTLEKFNFTIELAKKVKYRSSLFRRQTEENGEPHVAVVHLFGDGNPGGLKMRELPEEVTGLYPWLNEASTIPYVSSTFVFVNNDEENYSRFLNENFDPVPEPLVRTFFSITK